MSGVPLASPPTGDTPTPPNRMTLTVPQLKALCKELKITGYSKLGKAALLEKLAEHDGGSPTVSGPSTGTQAPPPFSSSQSDAGATRCDPSGCKVSNSATGVSFGDDSARDGDVAPVPAPQARMPTMAQSSQIESTDSSSTLMPPPPVPISHSSTTQSSTQAPSKRKPAQMPSISAGKKQRLSNPAEPLSKSMLPKASDKATSRPVAGSHSSRMPFAKPSPAQPAGGPANSSAPSRNETAPKPPTTAMKPKHSNMTSSGRPFLAASLKKPVSLSTTINLPLSAQNTTPSSDSDTPAPPGKRFQKLVPSARGKGPPVPAASSKPKELRTQPYTYLEFPSSATITLQAITLPPSLSQRKHVRRWAVILSGLADPERRRCAMASRTLRYAGSSRKLPLKLSALRTQTLTRRIQSTSPPQRSFLETSAVAASPK